MLYCKLVLFIHFIEGKVYSSSIKNYITSASNMITRNDAWATVIWVIIIPSILVKILEKMALVKNNMILDC